MDITTDLIRWNGFLTVSPRKLGRETGDSSRRSADIKEESFLKDDSLGKEWIFGPMFRNLEFTAAGIFTDPGKLQRLLKWHDSCMLLPVSAPEGTSGRVGIPIQGTTLNPS